IIDELPALRRELRRAIGIGMGSCADPSAPARGSLRGTVVRFRSDYERMVGTRFGVLISEPGYSLERQWQNIVPIFNADEFGPKALDLVSTGGWLAQTGMERAHVLHQATQFCSTDDHIESGMPEAIDAETMKQLEARLT